MPAANAQPAMFVLSDLLNLSVDFDQVVKIGRLVQVCAAGHMPLLELTQPDSFYFSIYFVIFSIKHVSRICK